MQGRSTGEEARGGASRLPLVPHMVVSVALGAVFVVALFLAAALPAIAAAYVVVGFAVRDVVVVLVLWAASATTTIAAYLVISRTFVRAVLRRRVVARLPLGRSDE